jgi:AraC-like DNA-binding protein
VGSLARAASVSRSILAERFSKVLGTPPMSYVARWRLQLASHRLRTTDDGLAAIARDVGYDSEAAFGRAFKRHVGTSPGAWRARQWPRREAGVRGSPGLGAGYESPSAGTDARTTTTGFTRSAPSIAR